MERVEKHYISLYLVLLALYTSECDKPIQIHEKTAILNDGPGHASDIKTLSNDVFDKGHATRKVEWRPTTVSQSRTLSAKRSEHFYKRNEKLLSQIMIRGMSAPKKDKTKNIYISDSKNSDKLHSKSYLLNALMKIFRERTLPRNHDTGGKNVKRSIEEEDISSKRDLQKNEMNIFYNHTDTTGTQSLPTCSISLYERSKTIFHSQLISREPNFIQFSLSTCHSQSVKPTFTDDVFMGMRWFWTYNTSAGPYPFLSWNLDYGILSFHLLEAGTINVPYVCVHITSRDPRFNCDFTFGKDGVSKIVTETLIPLIDVKEGSDIIKYPESYFCYLATRQDYCNTLRYWAAVYLYYPIRFIHYKCCSVVMNYTSSNFQTKCQEKNISGVHTWLVTTELPYFLGVLFLLYFPIMLFNISAWLSKDEIIHEDLIEFEMTEDFECQETINNNWIFANGCSPFTLGDILSFKSIGLSLHPVIVSRLRRLLFVLTFPIFIYIQIVMYADGMGQWSKEKIHVRDLVKVGAPMGFLALLGDAGDRRKVFVPFLGGPLGIVILYYSLSLLFIALPRSVKQVIETGIPTSNLFINTPLLFGSREIIEMSKINVKEYHMKPGYTKAATLMKCRFYMLFTPEFWKRVWNIQIDRIGFLLKADSLCCLCLIFLPFYFVFCLIEILLCILYHGLPFCNFVSCMINGGLKSLRYLKGQSRILNAIFKQRLACFIGVSFMLILYMVYIYVIFLVFIISLGFIFNVITHCFVAIIIYPSVSFGYLFFFIVLFYYFINLIRDFGDGYTELLSTAVDVSRHLSRDKSRVMVIDGKLTITNVQIENIVDVRINDISLQISSNTLRKIETTRFVKIKEKDSAYGIPKELFNFIVTRHRPIHQQVIVLCFKAVIMITFVILTLSISADYVGGPTTEISEVMHVIFIVAVGALPQLVQAILSRSDTLLKYEIEEREIEKSVIEFWNQQATRNSHHCNYGSI